MTEPAAGVNHARGATEALGECPLGWKADIGQQPRRRDVPNQGVRVPVHHLHLRHADGTTVEPGQGDKRDRKRKKCVATQAGELRPHSQRIVGR